MAKVGNVEYLHRIRGGATRHNQFGSKGEKGKKTKKEKNSGATGNHQDRTRHDRTEQNRIRQDSQPFYIVPNPVPQSAEHPHSPARSSSDSRTVASAIDAIPPYPYNFVLGLAAGGGGTSSRLDLSRRS